MAIKILKKPDDPAGWMLSAYCDCGCRLRTNTAGKLVWCSGVNCDTIMPKARFLELFKFDDNTKRWHEK